MKKFYDAMKNFIDDEKKCYTMKKMLQNEKSCYNIKNLIALKISS